MRVRIHLNLAKAEQAQVTIRALNPNTNGWPTIGYATSLLLQEVKPVIHGAVADRIASGDLRHKSPHAFLEGELISWAGMIRKDDRYYELLSDLCDKQKISDFEVLKNQRPVFNAASFIGYNPKFARLFYKHENNHSDIRQAFMGAERLAVCGWFFAADKPVFEDMSERDFIRTPPRSTHFEKTTIPKGFAVTRQKLNHLGLA